jgi:NDP-mannose synthase
MTVAMIMAGGRSSRMRAGGVADHKGLIEVLGVPLVERNVNTLLAAGFRNIVVAVAAGERALQEFIETRCRRLAEARGAALRCFVEREPLGTIGAVRTVLPEAKEVVVVNVDNLTTLDLRAMLLRHRAVHASMTVAVHWEPFSIPYGEVELDNGWVQELHEKPVKHYRMSSGTYVVGPEAASAFPAKGGIGAPELFDRLKRAGGRIAAFEHVRRWVDVNDNDGVFKAEQMILNDGTDYSGQSDNPDHEVFALLVHEAGRIWLRSPGVHTNRYPGLWGLPAYENDPSSGVEDSAAQQCEHSSLRASPFFSFDDLESHSGEFIRHHVFELNGREYTPTGEGEWLDLGNGRDLRLSSPAKRALAILHRVRVKRGWNGPVSVEMNEMAETGT